VALLPSAHGVLPASRTYCQYYQYIINAGAFLQKKLFTKILKTGVLWSHFVTPTLLLPLTRSDWKLSLPCKPGLG